MKARRYGYIIISALLLIILSSCDLILMSGSSFTTPSWARGTWTGPAGTLIISDDSISGTIYVYGDKYPFSTSAILDYPGAYVSDIDYGYSASGRYDYLDLTLHSGYYGYTTSFHIIRTYRDTLELVIVEGLSPVRTYSGIYYRN